jgi:hypothetical protein
MAQGWLNSRRWEDYEAQTVSGAPKVRPELENQVLKEVIDSHFPALKDHYDSYVMGAESIPAEVRTVLEEELDARR